MPKASQAGTRPSVRIVFRHWLGRVPSRDTMTYVHAIVDGMTALREFRAIQTTCFPGRATTRERSCADPGSRPLNNCEDVIPDSRIVSLKLNAASGNAKGGSGVNLEHHPCGSLPWVPSIVPIARTSPSLLSEGGRISAELRAPSPGADDINSDKFIKAGRAGLSPRGEASHGRV